MALDEKEQDDFYRVAHRDTAGDEQQAAEDALCEFRQEQEDWTPRTPLGRRLKELRERFIAEGGKLVTPEEIDAEVRERRGGAHLED